MEFTCLAGKIALGIASAKDYTDWAEDMLVKGSESDNIAILAGLGLDKTPDFEEVKYYFYRSLKDLGLELPTENTSILSYARYICAEMVEGNIVPMTGLSILEDFHSKSNYQPIYGIWANLSEDIWMLSNGEHCIFNTGLTQENAEQYITNFAKQFLKLIEIELPENFFQLTVCQKCGYIGEQKTERIEMPWMPDRLFWFFYRKLPVWRGVCANCGEPYPLGMGNYIGREQYIERI